MVKLEPNLFKELLEPQGCKMTPILPAQLLNFLLEPLFILALVPGLHLSQPQLIERVVIK